MSERNFLGLKVQSSKKNQRVEIFLNCLCAIENTLK